jgi:GNAT superfamily N-acetyltransferase
MFMIFNKDIDEVQRHIEFFQEKHCHEWVAYKNGAPVGFIKIAPTAETFISDHPSVMNIKGFYVIESERKTGVGTLLFNTVQKWLLANKYPLCGVDYESINPLGSRFWMKYFTPYTYSLVRKIDERIL